MESKMLEIPRFKNPRQKDEEKEIKNARDS